MRGAIAVALLLLTAACGPLPRPFARPAGGADFPLAALTIDVRVAPVAGLPAPAGEALARAVADSLGAYGVTATARHGIASRFVLAGNYTDPAPSTGTPPSHRAQIVWTLFDADGTTTGIHTQAVDATLAAKADAATLHAAGMAPAKALASLINAGSALPGVPHTGKGLFLAGISGAPGDGNTALAIALRLALAHSSLGSADKASAAAYILHGTVAVEPPQEGVQTVEIRWRVTTRAGGSVGEAVQRNVVPAGSLDGRWGVVAGLAAHGAVDGIADIVKRAGESGPAPRQTIILPSSLDLPVPTRKAPLPSAAPAAR